MARAGIEKCRRGRNKKKSGQRFVELEGAAVFLRAFMKRQAHRHAQPEVLRGFQTPALVLDQITVIKRLQSHVGELFVPLRTKPRRQAVQVESEQSRIEPLDADSLLQVFLEAVSIRGFKVPGTFRQRLAINSIEQQPGGDEGVGRLQFNSRLGGEDHCLADFIGTHAVVEVAHCFLRNRLPGAAVFQSAAGADDVTTDALRIERLTGPVRAGHEQLRLQLPVNRAVAAQSAGPAALLTVEDVAARCVVMPGRHQLRFDAVLNQFDLQQFTPDSAPKTFFHGRSGQPEYFGLHGLRQRLAL